MIVFGGVGVDGSAYVDGRVAGARENTEFHQYGGNDMSETEIIIGIFDITLRGRGFITLNSVCN